MPIEMAETHREAVGPESLPTAASSGRADAPSPARQDMTLLISLCLVAVTFALYEPSLQNAFVNFDDPGYIFQNAHVAQGLSWNNLKWAFTTTQESNWHPVAWLSYMATVQIFGLKAMGFHFVNVLLHAFNVGLLFFLLEKATRYIWRSALVACIFAVFPMNVEAVAWAMQQKGILSTAFLLLTLLAYGWYAKRPGFGRYVPVMLLFATSLMVKPIFVTLPFALLLLDYWPLNRLAPEQSESSLAGADGWASLRRQFGNLALEKLPLLFLSAAGAFAALYAARVTGMLTTSAAVKPLSLRIESAIWSYLQYIIKAVWPARLAVIYPFPDSVAPWKVITASAALVAITSLAWKFREKRYFLTGWLWFLGTLVPVIGIVHTGPQSMADRWAYDADLGLFVMAVWLTAEWAGKTRIPRWALAGASAFLILAYALVSYTQIGYWKDSYTLFSHTVAVTSRNGAAEDNLGSALQDMGRSDLAMPHFEAALQYLPQFSTAHYNVATMLQQQHRDEEAKSEYKLALDYTSSREEASRIHNNLGAICLRENQPAAALAEFNAALSYDPESQFSMLNRGALEYRQGNLDGARADFSRAVAMAPSPAVYFLLGRMLEEQGQLKPAMDAYGAALSLAPGLTEARQRMAAIQAKIGQ